MGDVAYDHSMVQDKDLQDQAASIAQQMERELRAAIAGGGFNGNTVRSLVAKWTELGMLAKGSGYWNNTRYIWNLSSGAGHFAKKTSEELLNRMVRLENALSKHADIKERFFAFNDAQDAIRALVYEYRSKLKQRGPSEVQQFDGQLVAFLGAMDPNAWRRLGD